MCSKNHQNFIELERLSIINNNAVTFEFVFQLFLCFFPSSHFMQTKHNLFVTDQRRIFASKKCAIM